MTKVHQNDLKLKRKVVTVEAAWRRRHEHTEDTFAACVQALVGSQGRQEIDCNKRVVRISRSFHHGEEHVQIMSYDLKSMGLHSMFVSGTIFTMDWNIYKNTTLAILVGLLSMLMLACAAPSSEYEKLDMTGLNELVRLMNAFTPFTLTLYVAISMKRWWDVRVIAISALFEGLANVYLIVSACMPGPVWEKGRLQILKYGMASLNLTTMAARAKATGKEEDYDKLLIDDGLLNAEECNAMIGMSPFHRAMLLWGWILRISEEMLRRAKAPGARQNTIITLASKARNGINKIHTYMDSQLPFAYVHLITLTVSLHNTILAVYCGFGIMMAHAKGNTQLIVCNVITLLLGCFFYQGLLSISYVVQDPFGNEIDAFALAHYIEYACSSCVAIERGLGHCPALERVSMKKVIPDPVKCPDTKTVATRCSSQNSFHPVAESTTNTEPVTQGRYSL